MGPFRGGRQVGARVHLGHTPRRGPLTPLRGTLRPSHPQALLPRVCIGTGARARAQAGLTLTLVYPRHVLATLLWPKTLTALPRRPGFTLLTEGCVMTAVPTMALTRGRGHPPRTPFPCPVLAPSPAPDHPAPSPPPDPDRSAPSRPLHPPRITLPLLRHPPRSALPRPGPVTHPGSLSPRPNPINRPRTTLPRLGPRHLPRIALPRPSTRPCPTTTPGPGPAPRPGSRAPPRTTLDSVPPRTTLDALSGSTPTNLSINAPVSLPPTGSAAIGARVPLSSEVRAPCRARVETSDVRADFLSWLRSPRPSLPVATLRRPPV